jgi:ankyrin repeat protein
MADPRSAPPADDPAQQAARASRNLIQWTFAHDLERVRAALQAGADVDTVDPATGLAPLHIAVGQNDGALCRFLIEEGRARFFPDMFGRMPTIVAAECGIDDDLADYIGEKEAAHEAAVDALSQTMPKIPPRDHS